MDTDPYALATLWCRACQDASCRHLAALRSDLLAIKDREAALSRREAEVSVAVDFLYRVVLDFEPPK